MAMMAFALSLILLSGAALIIPPLLRTRKRIRNLPQSHTERILVLGASSGIGKEIALQYASSGRNRICLVGRKKDQLEEAAEECKGLGVESVVSFVGDISSVEDMLRLREVLESEFGGIDTIIVSAGVSATRPLLDIAPSDDENGVQRVVDVASKAMQVNYLGPVVVAVTFIPLLKRTSSSPSILLISSLGAVIPAPTRSIYGSSKSASLLLYQSLAIEHPDIDWSMVLPSSVKGDFRASAVDGVPDTQREGGESNGKVKAEEEVTGKKLHPTDVAKRCILAIQRRERIVFMPGLMWYAHILYWIAPGWIERRAARKYGFVSR
ncbi:hypothetical protein VNI00_006852 [Paramarasmius palmivorus]|uniref:NAD(P)-binding protein n=1 Tax=Paramarasmius palmivorus TaxID=297713 RepID=A0AAW0D9S5_9AGAR